jgi:hypothetical protein
METATSFNVVISSNQCKDIYPDNKITNFKVKLAKRLNLNEKWRVGLSEISFTNSLYTIDREEKVYIYVEGSEETLTAPITIPPQVYRSVNELVNVINERVSDASAIRQVPELVFENDKITIDPGEISVAGQVKQVKLKFSPTLDNILGTSRYGRAFLNARHSNLFVYANIVQPRIVGQVNVQLLRQVDSQNNKPFGAHISHIFKRPYYCKLSNNDIEEIEIQLLDDAGRPPLFKLGTITLTLTFKHG